MKRILLFGNWNGIYHPIDEFGKRMEKLLEGMALTITDSEQDLLGLTKENYDLCIMYREFGMKQLSDEQTAAVITFVANGGPFLVLHNGISIQDRSELAQLIGGVFTEHPPYEELPRVHYMIEGEHPVTKGVRDFIMPDELYRFKLGNLADIKMILTYEENDIKYPAGWVRRFGMGQMVYLCCGHGAYAFDCKEFCTLVKNAVDWLLAGVKRESIER